MESSKHKGMGNFTIWLYLIILAIASVVLSNYIPAPINLVVIIVLSVCKAVLVAAYFMHLRSEKLLIHSLFFVPLILALILFIGMLPDINRWLY